MSSFFTDTVGTWSIAFADLPADLIGLISEVWESDGPICVGHMKLIPRGSVDLIINLGAHQAMYQEGDIASSQTFKHAWISGLFDRPLFIAHKLRSQSVINHLVAISFYHSSVLPVFSIPATDLVNRVFDADLLLGSEVLSLRQRMSECEDTQSRFSALLNFVRKLHQQLARPAPFPAI